MEIKDEHSKYNNYVVCCKAEKNKKGKVWSEGVRCLQEEGRAGRIDCPALSGMFEKTLVFSLPLSFSMRESLSL